MRATLFLQFAEESDNNNSPNSCDSVQNKKEFAHLLPKDSCGSNDSMQLKQKFSHHFALRLWNNPAIQLIRQMRKWQIDDTLDLYLVEETARYVYRIIAAKIMFSNPSAFGFRLRASDLYMPIPYKEVTVTTGITDLAAWAKKQGTTYAFLKNL